MFVSRLARVRSGAPQGFLIRPDSTCFLWVTGFTERSVLSELFLWQKLLFSQKLHWQPWPQTQTEHSHPQTCIMQPSSCPLFHSKMFHHVHCRRKLLWKCFCLLWCKTFLIGKISWEKKPLSINEATAPHTVGDTVTVIQVNTKPWPWRWCKQNSAIIQFIAHTCQTDTSTCLLWKMLIS